MKRVLFAVVVVTIGSVAAGCGVVLPSSDPFIMYGTEESLRAYHDSLNGLIVNAKTQDPNGNSAYWDTRQAQTRAEQNHRGFWQKLTSGSVATKAGE